MLGEREKMFGLSSKKNKLEKLYKKLLNESYQLSTTNRSKSDAKAAEAAEVLKQIDSIEENDK